MGRVMDKDSIPDPHQIGEPGAKDNEGSAER